ncbi:hypothetical protein FPZ12_027060 [Amycolatopsis acidicola]|uniref:VOC family protein n=2 Tax=Amycolatopsis acidicola TaxID=2596893 RepID=A0A5N0UV81_9PSEU|nr:hypothetical protein FPZ12_027060 [Amycolatopsis acidicola]
MVLAVAAVLTTAATAGTAAAAETGAPQVLFFNHSYGVLDRETADAIENSPYLREFANFQVRTTTGADGKVWTGRYLLGRETYLELFGVGDLPGQDGTLGSAGLGVSTEHAGDLATVRDRLPGLGVPEPIDFLQTRDFGDGVPVPWFDGILTTAAYDSFGAWAMEYRPEYLADPRAGVEPASYPGDVSRERYLADAYQDHLMRDVTAIRIAVTSRDLDATVPLLRAGGFAVHSQPGGVVATRGGTTIRFDAVPLAEVGLRQVEMSLNHPVSRHVEQLGTSTLVVGPGARASWTFSR